MKLSIVIPTYNEKENLRPLVEGIEKALSGAGGSYEILFIDDSTDDTPQPLAQMGAANPHIRYIHRMEKSGLASAVCPPSIGQRKSKKLLCCCPSGMRGSNHVMQLAQTAGGTPSVP